MYVKFFIILNFKIYAQLKITRTLKTISPKNNKTPRKWLIQVQGMNVLDMCGAFCCAGRERRPQR